MPSEDNVVRNRKKSSVYPNQKEDANKEKSKPKQKSAEQIPKEIKTEPGRNFWFTRVVFLRSLAFIYFVAFYVAFTQNKELIGDKGLLPLKAHLTLLKSKLGQDVASRFFNMPTLFWFLEPWEEVDIFLDFCAWSGMFLSTLIFVTGAANSIILTTLWLLYHSLVNVGQRWYSFGWESQLLETGFLAIWIVPVLKWSKFPTEYPTPWLAVVGYRWLIMRIMLGAGLIKIRGDKCWRDLTCMNYFYETQPNPNPVSYYAHWAPENWHKFETIGNHIVELILPWLTILPWRLPAMIQGSFQIFFQLMLISTGNLSFLNWLTILPSIWYFDDQSLAFLFGNSARRTREETDKLSCTGHLYNKARSLTNIIVGSLIAYLSIPIVKNLVSSNQVMNTSFEPFRLVNTYGAFGSVTKRRTEVIFEGTENADPNSKTATWMEYEFKCKPGNVTRTPCFISPFHNRLDWLMWFAAFQDYQSNPWLIHLAGKMLDNDPIVDSLLLHNPFRGKSPPKYVRARHFQYKFAFVGGSREFRNHQWWSRKYLKEYLPAVNRKMLQVAYDQFGWQN